MSAPSSDSELSVVIHSPPNPQPQQPQPQPQPQPNNVWLSSIMIEEIESSESSNTTMPKHKIHKVPQTLLQMGTESTKKCYEPQLVSIGPYHHNSQNLKSFEKIKFQFTREYVKSCGPSYSITDLYNKVADVAMEARNCYAEGTNIDDTEDFTQMMFLDGCFILQYIHYMMTYEEQAKMKMTNHAKAFVQRDLFLLENQLPFKVLRALMTMNSDFKEDKGLELINEFIQYKWPRRPPHISFQEMMENCITCITNPKTRHTEVPTTLGEPVHLLELVRRQLIKPNAFSLTGTENRGGGGNNFYSTILQKLIGLLKNLCREGERNNWYSYRSVQELKTAGIIFRPNQENILFTDVRYEPLFIRAILRLPPMIIDDSTQSLLLNLVAYEMCPDSPNDFGVTSYIWFMDTLIDNADDVKELRKKGILLNYLTDEEVAGLFNEIAKNLVPDFNAYKDVLNQIEKHYKNRVRLLMIVWMTKWLHTYFDTPWSFLGLLGAILAIVLTFIQTYIAIMSYHK
ncbi:UPF0481 protein [Camellia lanceoleosa]|uniref:UPF0481 protein n=1 Tax=Camellia lanceoleosa TaxID=1840588 RepID=A0ACC0GAV7_9ERIC|nr:UPF0481 protein [Camellia lanceoleosa]